MKGAAKLFFWIALSGLLIPCGYGLGQTSKGAGGKRASAGKGKALTGCRAIHRGGKYYLAQDVTCSERGFALDASGIKLDLNGHTITYGSPHAVVPAISICDQWYKRLPKAACGDGAHAHPEIFNGKIVQAAGSHGFTPAIWIGQATGLRGGSIHDLTITIQEPGAQAIHGDSPGSGWHVYRNVIYDRVVNIQEPGQSPLSARSHFQGVPLYFDNDNAAGAGNIFENNTIYGSAQGGILDATQNSTIRNNEIHLTSRYSNDYGVTVLADGQTVSGNVISGRGRGIDAEASRFTIINNRIDVHEDADNSEYSGCELGGGYGIRVKNYAGTKPSRQGLIAGNSVKVQGTHCAANGIDFSDLTPAVQLVVKGNTFITTAANGQIDAGISFSGAKNAAIAFVLNTVKATHGIKCSWDGCLATVQAGQKWEISGATVFAADGNSYPGSDSSMGAFPDQLTIEDAMTSPSVTCGAQSTLEVHIGSYTKKCVPKPNQ